MSTSLQDGHEERPEERPPSLKIPAGDSTDRNLTGVGNAALRSVSSLMGLQLVSRIVTFVFNQFLVRLASPQAFGTVSIQLELLLNTILFLSREGVRNALLRTDDGSDAAAAKKDGGGRRRQSAVQFANLSLLPIILGVPVSILASTAYISFASEDTRSQSYFHRAVYMYTLAAILELCCEPMHLRAVQELKPELRVRAEGLGIFAKTTATFAVMWLGFQQGSSPLVEKLALLAFSIGQVAYSVTVGLVYYITYGGSTPFAIMRTEGAKLTPSVKETMLDKAANKLSVYFDAVLFKISMAMTGQSVLKHFLTEGDKLIISRMSPLKDQGGYAVALNYGSLIARIFLQPIEETGRLFFSRTLVEPITQKGLHQAMLALDYIELFYQHFSLLIVCFAPPYLPILFHAVLPQRYFDTSAPKILETWVWYIPFLAINGILEAFVSSFASPAQLRTQSKWMTYITVFYILTTIVLYKYFHMDDTALVYANMVNLLLRTVYSELLIRKWARAKRQEIRNGDDSWETISRKEYQLPIVDCGAKVVPKRALMAFVAGAVATRKSAKYLKVAEVLEEYGLLGRPDVVALHVGVGVMSLIGVCYVCWKKEKSRIEYVYTVLKNRKSS